MQIEVAENYEEDANLTDVAAHHVIAAKDELSSKGRGDVDGEVGHTHEEVVNGQVEQQDVCRLAIQLLPEHADNDEQVARQSHSHEEQEDDASGQSTLLVWSLPALRGRVCAIQIIIKARVEG